LAAAEAELKETQDLKAMLQRKFDDQMAEKMLSKKELQRPERRWTRPTDLSTPCKTTRNVGS
jgi:hypothetical protein